MKGQHSMRLFDVFSSIEESFCFEYLKKGQIERVSTNKIERTSDLLGCVLIDSGLRKHDRVLTLLKDSPTWNIVELGVLKAGGVHVPLSSTIDKEKLSRVIGMVRPAIIIVESAAIETQIRSVMPKSGGTTILRLSNVELSGSINNEQRTLLQSAKNAVNANDTAVILFTSGSTSRPKGVLLSHRNILCAAKEFGASDAFSGVKRTLSVLPMSHSAARKVNYACQLQGITVCYAAPSLSLINNLWKFQSEHVALVPFLLQQLQQQIEANPKTALSLKKISCGGASLSASLWEWFNDRNFSVYEVYGLTETASLLSYSTDTCRRPNCVGLTASNIETRIVENGELEVRGSTVLEAYLLEAGTLQKAVDDNGWFSTGDIVSMSKDGGLEIRGRLKRSYKTQRGNHIYPEEMERSLSAIPGVVCAYLVNEPIDPISVLLVIRPESDKEKIWQSVVNYNRSVTEDQQVSKVAYVDHDVHEESFSGVKLKPQKQFANRYLDTLEYLTL